MLNSCTKKTIINRNALFHKHALPSFLDRSIQTPLPIFHPEDDVMTMDDASQEAGSIASISGIFPLTHTPPQVDRYRCRNRRARTVGGRRVWTSNGARVMWGWPIYGADQDKNGKRKTEKTKPPDKTKRENDKGLKKTKPPKRDGLAPVV